MSKYVQFCRLILLSAIVSLAACDETVVLEKCPQTGPGIDRDELGNAYGGIGSESKNMQQKFAGTAFFRTYGLHGVALQQLGGCKFDPPFLNFKLPDVPLEQSILAISGDAWANGKEITGYAEGVVECNSDRCEIQFSKRSSMKIR